MDRHSSSNQDGGIARRDLIVGSGILAAGSFALGLSWPRHSGPPQLSDDRPRAQAATGAIRDFIIEPIIVLPRYETPSAQLVAAARDIFQRATLYLAEDKGVALRTGKIGGYVNLPHSAQEMAWGDQYLTPFLNMRYRNTSPSTPVYLTSWEGPLNVWDGTKRAWGEAGGYSVETGSVVHLRPSDIRSSNAMTIEKPPTVLHELFHPAGVAHIDKPGDLMQTRASFTGSDYRVHVDPDGDDYFNGDRRDLPGAALSRYLTAFGGIQSGLEDYAATIMARGLDLGSVRTGAWVHRGRYDGPTTLRLAVADAYVIEFDRGAIFRSSTGHAHVHGDSWDACRRVGGVPVTGVPMASRKDNAATGVTRQQFSRGVLSWVPGQAVFEPSLPTRPLRPMVFGRSIER